MNANEVLANIALEMSGHKKGEYKFIMADHAIIGIRDATKNAKWNLLKDDLREQSDETIDFIYSLLK